MSVEQAPTPGWYDDGAGDGLWRYWNGRAWEEKYMPAPKPVRSWPWYAPVGLIVASAIVWLLLDKLTPIGHAMGWQ